MRVWKILWIWLLLSSTTMLLQAQTPGSLDAGFGDGGKVVIAYENQWLTGYDAAAQSDGKIVIVGRKAGTTNYNVYAVRLQQNGNVDIFGNMPDYFAYDFGLNSTGKVMHVLPDDKILIAGKMPSGIFMMRLTPDGQLDYTFAGTNAYFFYDEITDVEDIFVTGSGTNTAIYLAGKHLNHPAVLKTDEQGYVVNSFGDNGVMMLSLTGSLYSLDRDVTTGHFYGCGKTGNEGLVFKFDENGNLVTVFGDEGVVVVAAPSGGTILETCTVITDQSNNYITLFGDAFGINGGATDWDICSFRLNADGSWNTDYGVDGWSFALINDEDHLNTAIRQHDGKFYFGGSTRFLNPFQIDFFLGRVNPGGFMDPVFGDNGYVVTEMDDYDYITSLVLDEINGTIVAVGNADNLTSDETPILVNRYHTGYYVSDESSAKPPNGIRVMMLQSYGTPVLKIIPATADAFVVRIANMEGKTMVIPQQYHGITEIPLQVQPGLYLIQVQSDDEVLVQKVMVGF